MFLYSSLLRLIQMLKRKSQHHLTNGDRHAIQEWRVRASQSSHRCTWLSTTQRRRLLCIIFTNRFIRHYQASTCSYCIASLVWSRLRCYCRINFCTAASEEQVYLKGIPVRSPSWQMLASQKDHLRSCASAALLFQIMQGSIC
jgi:hypothetical protein